jgi:glycosyltransferase involved in cell wall biosynthesis
MGVDTSQWRPLAGPPDETVRIGWSGSPVNLKYLEALDPALMKLRARNPAFTLMVYSGQRPTLECPFEYHRFEPGTEPRFVQRLDIGLLPLKDEEYLRGKSPIKAIQYLACGVPVVGNVVGATAEILKSDWSVAISSEDDWVQALDDLIRDRARAGKMGAAGRRFVEQEHDTTICRQLLLDVITG